MAKRLTRGEVVWVRFSAGEGSEPDKTRPCIVVSNDGANSSAARHNRGVITVVPLTASRSVALPHQVALSRGASGLGEDSVAQIEQVRAVDVSRIAPTGREVNPLVMDQIDAALRVHLQL